MKYLLGVVLSLLIVGCGSISQPAPKTKSTDKEYITLDTTKNKSSNVKKAVKESPKKVVNNNMFDDKYIIGEVELVQVVPVGVTKKARIDTGATTTSIDAQDIVLFERDGKKWVKFKFAGKEIEKKLMGIVSIKRHVSNILSGLYSLGGKYDVAMIETLVEFDPVFDRYSYEGVPDIRVVVYRGFPAMAMLRCSTKESDGKANHHQGAVGVGIDLASGRAIKAVQHDEPVNTHPDTKYDFSELQIPHWERILPLAASCYDITNLGYLGVDIVLDKNLGPLILELNARPGLAIQIANGKGSVPRFNLIDKQPTNLSVEERVKFSLENFVG